MAFNFPKLPAENAEYTPVVGGQTYVYKNPRWVLKGAPLATPVLIVTGDAPPATPSPNLLWWESDTGNLFLYFNDGNSTQWIDVT